MPAPTAKIAASSGIAVASSEPKASSSTMAAAASPIADAAGERAALQGLEPAAAELDLEVRAAQSWRAAVDQWGDVGLGQVLVALGEAHNGVGGALVGADL